ncbi:HhoA/HhoB/HtrA family serine endopeptidase [Leptothoe spongobia]|uniref:Trypsin-like peptidase domain-containing protein n=1 Tax=Leptothoe spongobia TAU-MAC 1115 TaxID=1967444 RepID=A0A947GK73_9CYAN|nr:HhoA/HhoB/HtrA family serine endopeptidase [Leptothoe spongobia]MBT9317620.1 trypsin-like peptidase domain-containing protein [Leptothoe spongobia TAU-MAC 1115]
MRQIRNYALVIVLSVALTLSSLRLFSKWIIPPSVAEVAPPTTQLVQASRIPDTPHNFVAAAVDRVGPAVVRVDTERTVAPRAPDPFFDDPFFRGFFGDDAFPRVPQEFRQQGQGSGFIVDRSGLVLTNAHVVSGADKVTVTLKDGRTFDGEVKGTDEPSDLAVVKIQGDNLPVAPEGDSSQLQVGDWAIAVGNPLGLDNTVTLGIISTLNRSSSQVGIPDKRLDFVQTDAAINPGNSGGPLVNEQGEVIGINTAIRADAEGIGFAIPINKAKEIQSFLAEGKRVPHPFIGIQMTNLTVEQAKQFNEDPNSVLTMPETEGVLIVQVVPDSPAAKGGLRRGDVIVKIDGEAVTTAEQLQDTVEGSKIGQGLRFEVIRGEQTESLTVRPAELQEVGQ